VYPFTNVNYVRHVPNDIRLEEAFVLAGSGLLLNAVSSRRRQQIRTQYSARLPRHQFDPSSCCPRRYGVIAECVFAPSTSPHLTEGA
jgi:hypothetical protein